jgi:hypothetical protein
MRGFLHCAPHDDTVTSFGRNDAVFRWVREGNDNDNRNNNDKDKDNGNGNPPSSMKLKGWATRELFGVRRLLVGEGGFAGGFELVFGEPVDGGGGGDGLPAQVQAEAD